MNGLSSPLPDPVFLLGSNKSGVTILYRMLAHHPDLSWLSQYSGRDGRLPDLPRMPGARPLDRVLRRVSRPGWKKHQSGLRRLVVPTPTDAQQIWDHVLAAPEAGVDDGFDQRLRDTIGREIGFLSPRPLLVKQPRLYRYVGRLVETFPAARFIHVVRDGRAVAIDVTQKMQKTSPAIARNEELLRAIRRWAQVVETIERDTLGLPVFRVRYEDLCGDVHLWLKRCLRHIGVSPDRFPFDALPTSLRCTNQRRFHRVGRDDVELLTGACRERLMSMGYALANEVLTYD